MQFHHISHIYKDFGVRYLVPLYFKFATIRITAVNHFSVIPAVIRKRLRNGGEEHHNVEILSPTFVSFLPTLMWKQFYVLKKYCFQKCEVIHAVLGLLVMFLHHRKYGGWGWRQQGRYVKSKSQKNGPVYCSRVTWCSTRAHTVTSDPQPWYSRKIRVENVLLSFFNHALPTFKVRPVSPEFRVESDWLKWAAP